ncbi:MAG: hypothetical protein JXJ04_19890 [Spirochaetales bacterium]|nr:hypothetical protein [Spirochaetales bacterium]
MVKLSVKVLSWGVAGFNGIIAVLLTIDILSGGTWVERAGLKHFASVLPWIWFIAIPVISITVLILNYRIRWKIGNYIHGTTLFFWLFSLLLTLWIVKSGFIYW